jgi:hypothetical protein
MAVVDYSGVFPEALGCWALIKGEVGSIDSIWRIFQISLAIFGAV